MSKHPETSTMIPSAVMRDIYQSAKNIDRSDLKLEDLLGEYYGKGRVPEDTLSLAKKERAPKRNYIAAIQRGYQYTEAVRGRAQSYLNALDEQMPGWTRATSLGSNFAYNVGRCPGLYRAQKHKNIWYVPKEVAEKYLAKWEVQAA